MENKKLNKVIFLCAVILQIGILLSIPVVKEANIRGGRTIIVKTVPIDPRSFFRGDYVVLNYEFSRLDLNKIGHDKEYFNRGEKVFVKLSKTQDSWEAVGVSAKPPKEIKPGEVMIVGSVNNRPWQNNLGVVYGIESYFVPEGQGRYIERNIGDKRVTVELSVDKRGYVSVRKIFINGEEVTFR